MTAPSPRFTIVTTTINVPTLLTSYANDALRFGHKTDIIVAGDRKTPAAAETYCKELTDKSGIVCRYLSVADQEKYLAERGADFGRFLPWNCIQRRNVATLMAYDGKAEIIAVIDDDNLLCQPDYLGRHSHLGQTLELDAVHSQSGWWNVCDMLKEARGTRFYPRGYPLTKRWVDDEIYQTRTKITARAVVNAGLWLDDPDVDAIARLACPIRAVGPSDSYHSRIACDVGTWSPFNSQNTALHRDVIPAYILFPFVGRYDDIWAGYVVRRISDHLGDVVTYGDPLVRQKRNPHNLFIDFDLERLGLETTETFIEALHACALTGKNYRDCFIELAGQFEGAIAAACVKPKINPAAFARVVEAMKLWAALF